LASKRIPCPAATRASTRGWGSLSTRRPRTSMAKIRFSTRRAKIRFSTRRALRPKPRPPCGGSTPGCRAARRSAPRTAAPAAPGRLVHDAILPAATDKTLSFRPRLMAGLWSRSITAGEGLSRLPLGQQGGGPMILLSGTRSAWCFARVVEPGQDVPHRLEPGRFLSLLLTTVHGASGCRCRRTWPPWPRCSRPTCRGTGCPSG